MSENVGKSQEDVENRPEIAEVNFRKGKVRQQEVDIPKGIRQQEMDTPKGIVRQQAEAVGGGKEADHGEL